MTEELAAFEIPIRAKGEDLVLGAFDRIDQAGSRVLSRVGTIDVRVAGADQAAQALATVGARASDTAVKAEAALRRLGVPAGQIDAALQKMGIDAAAAHGRVTTTAVPAQAALSAVGNRAAEAGRRLQAIGQNTGGLDAIRRRTDLLTEGLQRSSTSAQALVQLQGAERALTTALTAGNLTLTQRIRLETELLRVRRAIASAPLPPPVPLAPAVGDAGAAQATGALGTAVAGVRTRLSGFAAGFIGGAAATAAMGVAQQAIGFITGTADAADNLETSLRRLNATSRLTGEPLEKLRAITLGVRSELNLSTNEAVSFTAAMTRLSQRAGDTARTGAALTAWLDLAAANGMTATDALQALQTTIIGQDEGLNRLGLANPQQLYEQWARAAGTTAAKMTEAEKALAILTAVQQAGAKVTGEWAKQQETAAGAADRLKRSVVELQERLGGLAAPARLFTSAFAADVIQGTTREVDFLKRVAAGLADEFRDLLRIGETIARLQFRNVQGGGSSTAPNMPDITVSGAEANEAADKRVAELTKAITLGTADAAMRREAAGAARAYAAAAADESRSLEQRNQHAERAKALTEALTAAGKAGKDALEAAAKAVRDRSMALVTLAQLEAPTPERWGEMRARLDQITTALAQGNVPLEERIRLLREQAALEEATSFGEPPARPQMRRRDEVGIGIRGAETIPLPELPELEEWTRGLETRVIEVVRRVADRLKTTAEDALATVKGTAAAMAQTFADSIRGAFDAAFSGGNVFAGALKAILAGLGGIFMQMGTAMMAAAPIFIKLSAALWNPLTSGPALLAHGALLVALGATLGAIAHAIPSGGGGGARATVGGGGGANLQPITTIIRVSSNTLAQAPSTRAVDRAAMLPPAKTFHNHWTVIGPHDPQAQRMIGQLAEAGARRGLRFGGA